MPLKTFNIKIKGIEKLRQELLTLERQTQGKVLQDASFEGVDMIRKRAQQIVPIGIDKVFKYRGTKTIHHKAGNLKRSIKARRLKRQHPRLGEAAVRVRRRRGGDSPYYGYFVEYGTVKMVSPDTGHRPFMRPAFEIEKRRAIARSIRHLRSRVRALRGA